MKKLLKLNLFFCFFALAIACVFPLAIPKGSVFAAEPVLPAEPIVVTISDAASLNAFRDSVNDGTFVVGSTAVLTADIAFMAPGENFVPIGTKEHPFVGTFDGGGNCISGLNFLCEDSSVMNAGFFGVVKHGEIKNLGIKNISIKLTNVFAKSESRLNVGGLCGHAIKTRITNCFVENTNNMTAIDISSKINTFVGGIVGLLEDSTIYNAFSSAKISAYATSDAKDATFNAGGLAGMIAGSEILNCYSLSDLELKNLNDSYVNLTNNIGGIVGFVNDFNVMLKNNFFVGDITTFSRNNATYNMGTIVGAFHSNSIFVPESGKINYCNFSKDGNKNVGIDWVGKISTYSDAGLFFKQCSNEFFKTNISFSDREKWDENM
ncbi:MAG: GLUG motif-containing protein, partial [Clostridia bacterium]